MRWSRLDRTYITICWTLPTVCDDILSVVCLSVGGMRGFSMHLYTQSSACLSTCRAHVLSVWKKYYLLVIFYTETDGVIIISSNNEDSDGPQTDEDPSFFFPGDSRQHAANVLDDAARQRNPGAATGDAERQPHDLDFAEGRVFQLRYVYCLNLDLRAQQTLKEILQGR